MSLAIIDDVFHLEYLHPDRIVVLYQYGVPGVTGWLPAATHPAIARAGLRPVSRRRAFSGRVIASETGTHATVYVTKPRNESPINVQLTFNVLTHLHDTTGTDTGERARERGKTNWLHADAVQSDNGWVVDELSNLIRFFEPEAYSVAGLVASAISPHGQVGLVSISVAEIEIAADIEAREPHVLVRRFAPALARLCQSPEEREYPLSTSETSAEGSLALSGFYRNARYKVYEKTDRRIRIECLFRGRAFQGIPTTLAFGDDVEENQTFHHFFQILARRCLPIFEQLRQEAAEGMPSGFGPLHLISMIYGLIRRPEKADELFLLLVRQQRVRSRFDHAVIRRLRGAGLLIESGERGSYMLHPSYRSAADRLNRVDEGFWSAEQPINVLAAPHGDRYPWLCGIASRLGGQHHQYRFRG